MLQSVVTTLDIIQINHAIVADVQLSESLLANFSSKVVHFANNYTQELVIGDAA
jgi:hypothetical protein